MPKPKLFAAAILAVFLVSLASFSAQLPALKVSDNRRFLVTEKGEPFFWLGDTAWELFHRLNREEAEQYLKNRVDLGNPAHLRLTGAITLAGKCPACSRSVTASVGVLCAANGTE